MTHDTQNNKEQFIDKLWAFVDANITEHPAECLVMLPEIEKKAEEMLTKKDDVRAMQKETFKKYGQIANAAFKLGDHETLFAARSWQHDHIGRISAGDFTNYPERPIYRNAISQAKDLAYAQNDPAAVLTYTRWQVNHTFSSNDADQARYVAELEPAEQLAVDAKKHTLYTNMVIFEAEAMPLSYQKSAYYIKNTLKFEYARQLAAEKGDSVREHMMEKEIKTQYRGYYALTKNMSYTKQNIADIAGTEVIPPGLNFAIAQDNYRYFKVDHEAMLQRRKYESQEI